MLSNFRGQTERRTFRKQFYNDVLAKLRNTTVAVVLQIDRKHYKNCHRHLNLNGSFCSSSSFFPGDGSAKHGLDPPGTLLSLCSVVPPRLVSSLLRPPACDLGIDLSSLSSSMSQFLKCIWRRVERGQERRGCRRRRKRRGTDVPCVVVLSPYRLTYQKSDMRQERANRGTDRSPLFVLHFPDLCLLSLLCSCSELEQRRFSKWPAAFFVYPTWRWQGGWSRLALTGHFQIKVQRVKNS